MLNKQKNKRYKLLNLKSKQKIKFIKNANYYKKSLICNKILNKFKISKNSKANKY